MIGTKIQHLNETVEKEFSNITKYLLVGNIDKLSLGTSGIFLNSILEHLHSVNILLSKGLIESAGSVATSLWERSITLQYMLTNHIEFAKIINSHEKVKRTPWNIKEMVNGIIEAENHTQRNPEIEKDLLYLQYTYLCAIKHGNPFTISYLNRFEKDSKKVIGVKTNFTKEDEDIKHYLFLLSITTAFDALLKFSKIYCTTEKQEQLKKINTEITRQITMEINLNVPQIISTSATEFKAEFWEYLKELNPKNGN